MGCTRTPLRLLVAATLVNIVLIIEVPQIESQRVVLRLLVHQFLVAGLDGMVLGVGRGAVTLLLKDSPQKITRGCDVLLRRRAAGIE